MEASNPNSPIQNVLYPRENIQPVKSPVVSTTELLGMTDFSNDDLGKAIGLIANQLGVSPMLARRLLYQMAGQGISRNMQELRQFLQQHGDLQDVQQDLSNKSVPADAANKTAPSSAEAASTAKANLNPYAQSRLMNNQLRTDRFTEQSRSLAGNAEQKLSTLVQSPKAFASWLVNNKSAYVLMRAKPQLTYLLMALANPKIKHSPALLAELAKLLAQSVKLKQGKSVTESREESDIETRGQEVLQEAMDHKHTVVSSIRDAIEIIPLAPLRDFLLEAERFAEEDVANMWSIAFKKEKEIENKILEKLKQFKKHE